MANKILTTWPRIGSGVTLLCTSLDPTAEQAHVRAPQWTRGAFPRPVVRVGFHWPQLYIHTSIIQTPCYPRMHAFFQLEIPWSQLCVREVCPLFLCNATSSLRHNSHFCWLPLAWAWSCVSINVASLHPSLVAGISTATRSPHCPSVCSGGQNSWRNCELFGCVHVVIVDKIVMNSESNHSNLWWKYVY